MNLPDYRPVLEKRMTVLEFSQGFTREELKAFTNKSIDTLLDILDGLTDADMIFEPTDSNADDPHATEGEEKIGWSLAHLVAHVTASSEEGAALSSLLARGFATAERPRYETPWRDLVTHAQCVQRLEESRRMRLAYLDTWPDEPHLDVYRNVSEQFTAAFGPMNAQAALIFGLYHEVGHHEQFREVRRQALKARAVTT